MAGEDRNVLSFLRWSGDDIRLKYRNTCIKLPSFCAKCAIEKATVKPEEPTIRTVVGTFISNFCGNDHIVSIGKENVAKTRSGFDGVVKE